MNTGALIIGIGFLCMAILDILGCKEQIRKKYREYMNIRKWQKRRSVAEIIISIGAGTIFFSRSKQEIYIFGCIVLFLGFVLLFIIDSKFKRDGKKSPG